MPLPPAKPEDQWSHSELLLEAARLGGMSLIEVLRVRPDMADLENPQTFKWAKLKVEAGGQALRLLALVQESKMRQESEDRWADIAERVQAEKLRLKQIQQDRQKEREGEGR